MGLGFMLEGREKWKNPEKLSLNKTYKDWWKDKAISYILNNLCVLSTITWWISVSSVAAFANLRFCQTFSYETVSITPWQRVICNGDLDFWYTAGHPLALDGKEKIEVSQWS